MNYKVVRQYARGPESHFATFYDLADARMFIEAKMAQDAMMKVAVIYRITELGDVIEEFDSAKRLGSANPAPGAGEGTSAGSGVGAGRQSAENFRPSPLNTSPRPPGMPANNWSKDKPGQDDE